MSEFAPKSGSTQAPTETESLLAGKMAEHRLNEWTDTNSMDSMKDLQGYLEGRPMQGNYDEKITQAEKDPLEAGIFQNDVFYDRESDTVFSIDSQREVGGEKVYSISTVSKNGSESKEIMTEAEVRAYLQGKELVDEGSDRRVNEESKFQGEFETKSATSETTEAESQKADEPNAPKREKKQKQNKQTKTSQATPEAKTDTTAEDNSEEKADEPKKQAVFTSKFGELSPKEQARVIDAAYGKNSSATLTPEQVAGYDNIVAESIVKAATANGYKSAEQVPAEKTADTNTATPAATPENTGSDDSKTSSEEVDGSTARLTSAPATNGGPVTRVPYMPERRQTTPQTNHPNIEGENVDYAEPATVVLPVAGENGSVTPHALDDLDDSQLRNINNQAKAELDAENGTNTANDGETEESVEASRWGKLKAAFQRGYDRIGVAYAMGQARTGEKIRPDEDDPNSKKRIWIAAGAAAGVLVAVGGVWLATRGMGNGGSGGNAGAITPEMVAPPNTGGNGGETSTEVVKHLLDGYSVPQGGHGEDVMAAAGRSNADWYGGLGSELANKLPNEFTQLAANDIRINRPGVLSEEAQKIIENWRR